MKFSLINVSRQTGDRVSGNWIQDHIGTLDSATAAAQRTEAVNGNRIVVAVVDELPSVRDFGPFDNLRRLDRVTRCVDRVDEAPR